MSNNINSFAENMNALVRTSNNQMEILDALQRSLVNNSTTAYVNLKDPYTGEMTSYAIPALQGVVNRLSATENAIKNLLTGTGTVSLADGTSRSIQITPLAKIPENIYNVNNPTTFNIDSNWFFEDLMFPGITVRVNLQGQVDNDSDRVRVKRVIIDSRVAANQTVWYNNLANTSFNYLDLISLLNNSGIEYSEDEETLQFPLTNRSYQGQFVIQGSDIINKASARELEQRLCELRVLHVAADVNEVLLRRYLHQLIPIGSHLLHICCIGVERNHCEGLTSLRITWADVGTVTATQTVEY